MGYRNQMDTVTKALYIGSFTNRSVCLPYFSSDYRSAADISPQHFIDLNQTNLELAKIIQYDTRHQTLDSRVLITSDVAKSKCVCLLLQGDGAPAGMRRCAYGNRATTKMSSIMMKGWYSSVYHHLLFSVVVVAFIIEQQQALVLAFHDAEHHCHDKR